MNRSSNIYFRPNRWDGNVARAPGLGATDVEFSLFAGDRVTSAMGQAFLGVTHAAFCRQAESADAGSEAD